MIGVKISALPAANAANDSDQIEVNQDGTSRRVTMGQVQTMVAADLDMTGMPTAPTPALDDSSTQVPTTEWVNAVVAQFLSQAGYGTSAIVLDFISGLYTWNGSTSLSTALICQRADTQTAFAPNADGTWTSFAANAPRVGVGIGLLIESSTTNRLLRSRDLSNVVWTKSGLTLSDAGSSPVVGSVGFTVADVPVGSTSWAVPAGVTTIDVYAYGPGGNGAAGVTNTRSGAGGGAGAFTFLTGIAVTPSSSLEVRVPAGGAEAPVYLKNNAGTIVVSADHGRNAFDNVAGVAGNLTNCVGGSTKLSGGNGGGGSLGTANRGGGGGGGTPLPLVLSGLVSNYSGRTGSGGGISTGGGGGASNAAPGVTLSGSASAGLGGVGGSNHLGAGAGTGGTPTVAAGNGTAGGGGGGGSSGTGVNGSNGSACTASLSSGLISVSVSVAGAGGGGGGISGIGGNGAAGSGGGGGGSATATFAAGGTGGDGKLLIAYGSSNATRLTASSPGAYLAQAYTPLVPVTFTASITATTMTVTAVSSGIISIGLVIASAGVAVNTRIVAQLTGTFGGTGTYQVSISQTVGSQAMEAVPNRCPSLVAKPVTITGPVYLSQNGGVTQTDISTQLASGRWQQAFTPYSAVAVPEWRLTIANAGDAIDVDFTQLEDKTSATSPVPTTTAQATRPSDVITLNLAAFPAWITSDKLTVLQTVKPMFGNTGIAGGLLGSAWTWVELFGTGSSPMGSITASLASAVLTVTATSTVLEPYQILSGGGVAANTMIFAQLSGTPGGVGTYTCLPAQTVAETTMTVLPQHAYACNATIKSDGAQMTGCTVVNSLSSLVYGFDPPAEFAYRAWNKCGFSTTASLARGITALAGTTKLSEDRFSTGRWADPTKFTTVMVGGQMPGALNSLYGFVGELIIIPGAAWTAGQLAAWTAP